MGCGLRWRLAAEEGRSGLGLARGNDRSHVALWLHLVSIEILVDVDDFWDLSLRIKILFTIIRNYRLRSLILLIIVIAL